MEGADYDVEFYKALNERLKCFIFSQEIEGEVRLGKHKIARPLKTFLFYRLSMEREYYNQCRWKGVSINEAMERVNAYLSVFDLKNSNENQKKAVSDIRKHPWHETLSEYRGALIVYLFNARQLQHLTPLFLKLHHPVLLLSEYDIPEETELPDYVTALSIEFSDEHALSCKEIELHFPLIFHYANTFDVLLQIIRPCGVVCLEGGYFQEQLLTVVAASYGIPSYSNVNLEKIVAFLKNTPKT